MHILITGDSWANGAYDLKNCEEPTHPGLEYYLSEAGHRVTNLAVRGGSNHLAIKVLDLFLQSHKTPDLVLFMQCSFMREYRDYFDKSKSRNCQPDLLSNSNLDWHKNNIEDIVKPNFPLTCDQLQKFDIPVVVMGGNTKLHPIFKEYFPGMNCSFSQLGFSFEESYFDGRSDVEHFIKEFFIRTKLSTKEKYKFADDLMKNFMFKYDLWHSDNPFINEEHATTELHFKLYEHISLFLNK